MEGWPIDSYDGQASYEELHVKINGWHWREPPLEPQLFYKMRETMTTIEAEMNEVLDAI